MDRLYIIKDGYPPKKQTRKKGLFSMIHRLLIKQGRY